MNEWFKPISNDNQLSYDFFELFWWIIIISLFWWIHFYKIYRLEMSFIFLLTGADSNKPYLYMLKLFSKIVYCYQTEIASSRSLLFIPRLYSCLVAYRWFLRPEKQLFFALLRILHLWALYWNLAVFMLHDEAFSALSFQRIDFSFPGYIQEDVGVEERVWRRRCAGYSSKNILVLDYWFLSVYFNIKNKPNVGLKQ